MGYKTVLDSRVLISQLEDLESERAAFASALEATLEALGCELDEDDTEDVKEMIARFTNWSIDQEEEYVKLQAVCEEGRNATSEWDDGTILVHESYWVDYCQELVRDIGDLPSDIPSYIEINWDATAENIKADYTSIEYDDDTYYVRSA